MSSTSTFDMNSNVIKGFVAGGLAGVISKTTVAPIDRVKLILQLQNHKTEFVESGDGPSTSFKHSAKTSQFFSKQVPYKGIVDCFHRICTEQGVAALWRGNAASIIRCFPQNALNIAFRDYFRLVLVSKVNRQLNPWQFSISNLTAGGLSAAITLCFLYPLDFARTRLAVDGIFNNCNKRQFKGLFHCLSETCLQERGFYGLYRGFVASLQFTVASRAIFFGVFDTARTIISEDFLRQEFSFIMNWSLAQTSIILSSLICYPLDTVRRRIMLESGNKIKKYQSISDCFVKILNNEGAASFYKGALSNSLRCTSGALILAIYYELLKYL